MGILRLICVTMASVIVGLIVGASATPFDPQAVYSSVQGGRPIAHDFDPAPPPPSGVFAVSLSQSQLVLDCTSLNFASVFPLQFTRDLLREVEERSPSTDGISNWDQNLRGVIYTDGSGAIADIRVSQFAVWRPDGHTVSGPELTLTSERWRRYSTRAPHSSCHRSVRVEFVCRQRDAFCQVIEAS